MFCFWIQHTDLLNTGGAKIHSGLGIKPRVILLGLMKTSVRNKLSEVKMFIIDEFLMVSSHLFFRINAGLFEVSMCSTANLFCWVDSCICG